MRKPVVEVVGENLLLLAAVRLHPPNLHVPGALGIEIDVLTIGRVFGAIVEAFGSCEARLITAGNRDCVDVEIAIALADEGEGLTIG